MQRNLLRISALVMPMALGGCAMSSEEAGGPPSRTAAALERGLDEQVGVSTTPPVRRAPPQFDDADADAVRLFYEVLAPYGAWTDDARLGLVWIPGKNEVGDAFVPYGSHGRWTYRQVIGITEAGRAPVHEYIWVSDLPWGWVTFHYGRWAYTGDRGWAWVAGRRYGGAWVDWRAPHEQQADGVIGWGPTPPAHLWRVAPGPRPTRARNLVEKFDPETARLVPVPYVAFATPYSYVRSRDLFAPDLAMKLLPARAAMSVAYATDPGGAPNPARLGFHIEDVPPPPQMDRGLQQAWMLATPASASAIGAGPTLSSPPRLRTWVAGGPRYAIMH